MGRYLAFDNSSFHTQISFFIMENGEREKEEREEAGKKGEWLWHATPGVTVGSLSAIALAWLATWRGRLCGGYTEDTVMPCRFQPASSNVRTLCTASGGWLRAVASQACPAAPSTANSQKVLGILPYCPRWHRGRFLQGMKKSRKIHG